MDKTAGLMPLPDNTFWRVSAKALIFDTQRRLLVFKDKFGEWEIPGGGWEHGETFETCIKRELSEEMHLNVRSIACVSLCYPGVYPGRSERAQYAKLNVAAEVVIADNHFVPDDDDLVEARYVTKTEFLQLPFQPGEASVRDYADAIWE